MTENILMVDDDPLMHQLYRPHIERAGYKMLSAASGEEALEIAGRETLRMVIMDIMLPGMDGLATLRGLRHHENTKTVPAIVITSTTEYQVCRQEVKGIGAATFMSKPFGPAQLVAEIKRLLADGKKPEAA